MESYKNSTKLDLFISGHAKATSTLAYKIMTKSNHIFNYENGKMVEKNPKQSDYVKSIEFIRKQFLKAILTSKR